MITVDGMASSRWVLPIAPDNELLENHTVVMNQGKIVAVLPTDQAIQRYSTATHETLGEYVLMPGLVNAHAHTPMNLFRGLADDLPLMDWLQEHMWPAERALINPESVAIGSRLAIAEMIRGGVTCFNDHYFYPDSTAEVAIEEGMRAQLGCLVLNGKTAWAADEAGHFDHAQRILANRPDSDLITWSVAPHAPYTVSDDGLRQVKQLAETLDLQIHMHVHETAYEITDSLETYHKRPLQRLAELGLLSNRLIAVHMTQCTDDEMKLLCEHKVHVVHCPESNLKLASGFAPVSALLKAGVNVAIGTDGAASNNDLDLFAELNTAAMLAKAVSGDSTSLPASQALYMATMAGAKALGLEDTIGSLEPGKAADMIAVDLSGYLTQPIYHPSSHLVYAINRSQVSSVWVAGRRLLHNKCLEHIDTQALIQKVRVWADRAWPFATHENKAEEPV